MRENEALKVSYEEARAHLAAGNPDAAMAICRQYLAKYPNHAQFLKLKSDIEAQHPQSPELMQAIAEIDRRVQDEGDLDRRVLILEGALQQYPGEPHFVQALQDAREMRELIHSIAAQARFFEQQGQYNDALDQWQILRSIHAKQPGIEGEIQRVLQRRDTGRNRQ
ncbi:MAG: tetratricopeptide repeat protein [Ignavibacteriota bacterium]